ncbi:MOSC domain-containing protein [Rhodopseudomonas sp.]|uniref:MOSC domain-containing protein n=1 Tax=Rhodopseudomonas sp. TaxID=1078 RepID=UPI003B3BB287
MSIPASLSAIYRYPIKGLTPEPLPEVSLAVGQTLPADRAYAIENGPTGFDPSSPVWKAKTHYLMLMRNERLAALRSHFDDATQTLTIRQDGAEVARGDLRSAEGRAAIEAFFAARFADELRGPPKVLDGEGYSFSDVPMKVVSIINLGSVAALEQMVGRKVDPLRFRANLYIDAWPAWAELDMIDSILAIGDARLRIVKRTVRCAATNVDPVTAARDLAIPTTLQQNLGHADCGVYAEVIEGGAIAQGDAVRVA